jgi:hypothetical protein
MEKRKNEPGKIRLIKWSDIMRIRPAPNGGDDEDSAASSLRARSLSKGRRTGNEVLALLG